MATELLTRPAPRPEAGDGPEVRGIFRLTSRQLRFQRRVTLVMTVVPLAGVAFAIWRLWGTGITPLDFGLFLTFYALTGLGITVGFHRLFTHRSFKAARPVRAALAIFGTMAIQGPVLHWCATHRRHHAYADQYGDPHSPHLAKAPGVRGVLIGLFHAHVGWLFDKDASDPREWTPDLMADRTIRRISRGTGWIILASFTVPALIGLAVTGTVGGALSAFLWGSLARIFLLHHVTWSINSICHFYGKEAYRARDESKNVWPLAPLSFGESWHNNHHAFPWSARLGLHPWQVDFGWYLIKGLSMVGLARDAKVPTREQRDARRLAPGQSNASDSHA